MSEHLVGRGARQDGEVRMMHNVLFDTDEGAIGAGGAWGETRATAAA